MRHCTGSALYGPGTIRLLEIESERRVAGLQMLIGGGSFFWALEATRDYRLGAGRSLLILGGSWAGTLYGLGVPVFFEVGERQGLLGRRDDRYAGRRTDRSQTQFPQMVRERVRRT